jgi:hypothetical protein
MVKRSQYKSLQAKVHGHQERTPERTQALHAARAHGGVEEGVALVALDPALIARAVKVEMKARQRDKTGAHVADLGDHHSQLCGLETYPENSESLSSKLR